MEHFVRGRFTPRDFHAMDIELELDRSEVCRAHGREGCKLYTSEDEIKDALLTVDEETGDILTSRKSIFRREVPSRGKILFFYNRGDTRVTKLLLRPDEDNRLHASAIIVENQALGKSLKINVDDLCIQHWSTMGRFIIPATPYSLLQHIRDMFGGYLKLEFYENVDHRGYDLSIRSLLRHALNNIEIFLQGNQVSYGSTNTDALSYNYIKLARNAPSLGASVFANDDNNPNTRRSQRWSSRVGNAFSAHCEGDFLSHCALYGPKSQILKRRLGIDNSLSSMECGLLTGAATVGILSVLLHYRRADAVKTIKQSSLFFKVSRLAIGKKRAHPL